MTFDIDKAMSERFAKGPGFVDTNEGKVDATSAAKIKEINDKYDDRFSELNSALSYDDGSLGQLENERDNAVADVLQNADIMNEDGTVETPFFDANTSKKESDPWKSRIGIPEELDNYISKFISDAIMNNKEYFKDNPIPEIIREATPDWGYDDSDFNLDDLLFYALRNGARTNLAGNRRDRMRYKPDPDSRAKEQAAKLQAKKAKKTEKVNKSADIDARMSQWSAAGRAQHIGEIEPTLKNAPSSQSP